MLSLIFFVTALVIHSSTAASPPLRGINAKARTLADGDVETVTGPTIPVIPAGGCIHVTGEDYAGHWSSIDLKFSEPSGSENLQMRAYSMNECLDYSSGYTCVKTVGDVAEADRCSDTDIDNGLYTSSLQCSSGECTLGHSTLCGDAGTIVYVFKSTHTADITIASTQITKTDDYTLCDWADDAEDAANQLLLIVILIIVFSVLACVAGCCFCCPACPGYKRCQKNDKGGAEAVPTVELQAVRVAK